MSMTPAQSAILDQLSAAVEHFVQGARLAKVARDQGNEKIAEVISKIMGRELEEYDRRETQRLLMVAVSMFAEHLNAEHGPPQPDTSKADVAEFAETMDERLGAIVLAVDEDGNFTIPDDLPEPIRKVMEEVFMKDED